MTNWERQAAVCAAIHAATRAATHEAAYNAVGADFDDAVEAARRDIERARFDASVSVLLVPARQREGE